MKDGLCIDGSLDRDGICTWTGQHRVLDGVGDPTSQRGTVGGFLSLWNACCLLHSKMVFASFPLNRQHASACRVLWAKGLVQTVLVCLCGNTATMAPSMCFKTSKLIECTIWNLSLRHSRCEETRCVSHLALKIFFHGSDVASCKNSLTSCYHNSMLHKSK